MQQTIFEKKMVPRIPFVLHAYIQINLRAQKSSTSSKGFKIKARLNKKM